LGGVARQWVQAWTTSHSGDFAAYAAAGGRDGVAYALDVGCSLAVAPHGTAGEARGALREAGARLVTEPAWRLVSALRTVRRLESHADAAAIPTVSEALHGASALLGRHPHLRFVHEVVTTEDIVVRLLGRLARTGDPAALADALGPQLASRFRCPAPTQPACRGYVRRLGRPTSSPAPSPPCTRRSPEC